MSLFQIKKMSRLTPEQSTILSLLLDEVTGSEETIHARQDYCKVRDILEPINEPTFVNRNRFFTGSKSEGLDLPGSDEDFMREINDMFGINVTQSLHPTPEAFTSGLLYLCTKHTPPGFALLKCIEPWALNPVLTSALQNINGYQYLSSNIFIDTWTNSFSSSFKLINFAVARQGPSMETRHEREDRSQATDQVWCIHCDFWPIVATEWLHRPRRFGWPTSRDIETINNFGCHLVPIGHPHSYFKLMEWRLSFSLAEKILVWSFNHVQIQCYAVMKLILKEFIKVKCNPKNQVLCSYFVKTFLFWQFEKTDMHFWQKYNIGNCIGHLLREFCQCLREGLLARI